MTLTARFTKPPVSRFMDATAPEAVNGYAFKNDVYIAVL